MGYTNYWEFQKDVDKQKLRKALQVMSKIIEDNKDILAGGDGEGEPDVVVGAQGVSLAEEHVCFNGIDEMSHETFRISTDDIKEFDFCKTARKPYDIIVMACLVVLKYFVENQVIISSDGVDELYVDDKVLDGIRLAAKYVPIKNHVFFGDEQKKVTFKE